MDRVLLNEGDFETNIHQAVIVAKRLLTDRTNFLDDILVLNRIGIKLHHDIWDTEFHIFGVVCSDTDHLPTNSVRTKCSASMLDRSDKELEETIEFYDKEIISACKKIITKYHDV